MTTEAQEVKERREQRNIRTSLAFIRTIDAEKRTHLAELRTGIGILTIPMSLLTILIATSNYYSVAEVLGYVAALIAAIVVLFFIGGNLVASSLRRIRADDHLRKKCDDLDCMVSDFDGFNNDHD